MTVVPAANVAAPLVPTAALMPAGLDVTRSPLRPVAVTVRVTDVPGGLAVSVALRVAPPKEPLIVTVLEAVTDAVVMVNDALVAPAATVTLGGTVATVVLLLDSVTTARRRVRRWSGSPCPGMCCRRRRLPG